MHLRKPIAPIVALSLMAALGLAPVIAAERPAAHAPTAKKQEQRVRDLIAQLPKQHGLLSSQSTFFRMTSHDNARISNPAHDLIAMGYAAIPALIDALGDTRPTLSYQNWESLPGPSGARLSVGDCADTILSRIAGRTFWTAGSGSFSMQQAGQLENVRAAARQWWSDMQIKGERALLAQGVRAADNDSWKQADRLVKLDPEAALDALVAGLHHTKSSSSQAALIAHIDDIHTDAATRVLYRQMNDCRSVAGRVAAATALLSRGHKDVIGAMIRQWVQWREPSHDSPSKESDDVAPLIDFLGSCGDAAAMKALAGRFPAATLGTKFEILTSAAGLGGHRDTTGQIPKAVEALGERLVVDALEDTARQFGYAESRGKGMCNDPRVCDIAALRLAERWPQRYSFQWSITQFDRNPRIDKIRRQWRSAHDLPPLPARPAAPSDASAYNAALANSMTGGALPDTPIVLSEPVTAEAIVTTLHLLGRKLPANCFGFTLSVERRKVRRGIFVEVHWLHGPRPRWKSQDDFSFGVLLGNKSLYSGGGGTGREIDISADMVKAMATALADRAGQPIAITYFFQIERTPSMGDL